jgi:hypothetical protein
MGLVQIRNRETLNAVTSLRSRFRAVAECQRYLPDENEGS